MLRLPCGIMVEPGMTQADLLAMPEVKELIHKGAYDRSMRTYKSLLERDGEDSAYWDSLDDYNCTSMELQTEIIHRVRNCAISYAERKLEERASIEIMDLVWQQMSRDPDVMFGDSYPDEYDYDEAYSMAPGLEPRYAADCTDCRNPNPKSCSACHMFD